MALKAQKVGQQPSGLDGHEDKEEIIKLVKFVAQSDVGVGVERILGTGYEITDDLRDKRR